MKSIFAKVFIIIIINVYIPAVTIHYLEKYNEDKNKIIITYMQWGDPQEIKIVQKLIGDFEKENPDIKVQIIHAQDYYRKLNTMLAGGTPPDVFYVHAQDFYNYVEKGVLLDIQPFIERDSRDVNIEDFYPELVDAFKYKDHIYGIPKDFTTLVLYYNRDMFDEEKIPYPDASWDWKKFLEASMKLTKEKGSRGIRQYGFLGSFGFEAFIYMNGGKILSDDKKKCLLDMPEAVEAIQFFADLRTKYHVSPSSVESMDSPVGLNVGGSAMELAGRWRVPVFREITKFKWDVAPLPHGKKRATLIVVVSYGISKTCKNPEAAWKLVKYLTGAEGQKTVAELGLALPSRKSIAESPVFLESKPPDNNKVYLSSIKYGYFLPYCSKWAQISTVMNAKLDLVWSGDMTAKEACAIITKEVDKILAGEE
ncbi:MAG: sugar ABC transporter substrate-binding protein [Firmicutes bacterium]|nr:sugar ABC transporter substrate-binding protein [Bacillota bacterium]